MLFRTLLGLDDGTLGMIIGITPGFHCHLHAIAADGPFRPNGNFYCLPQRDLKEFEEILKSNVLAMLQRQEKIDAELIEELMNWPHSGTSIYDGSRNARGGVHGTLSSGKEAPIEGIAF